MIKHAGDISREANKPEIEHIVVCVLFETTNRYEPIQPISCAPIQKWDWGFKRVDLAVLSNYLK